VNAKEKRAIIDDCIRVAGTLAELSRRLKASPSQIINWRKRGVPPRWVLPLEVAVESQVSRFRISPELYPPEPKSSRQQAVLSA